MMVPPKNLTWSRQGKYLRELFDPHRVFTATKTLICNGKLIKAGEVFDKTLVNTRRLRQMYEQRMLDMAEPQKTMAALPKPNELVVPQKPKFTELSNEGLRIWLRNNGVIARPRATRQKLLELVEAKWKEYIDVLTSTQKAGSGNSEGISGQANDGDATEGGSDSG